MINNVFYFYYLNAIGGVETMFYYLAKKYSHKDIVIYYSKADAEQIQRLQKFVEVREYHGEKIKCKKAFFNYNINIIDNIEAEEYCALIHSDYKALGCPPITHPKITRYIAVSELAKKSYEEISNVKCEVCYNPVIPDTPTKTLKLISATRLTREKGKHRMIRLAELLDANNIPYQWTIFTDDIDEIKNPNIIYKKPCLNVIDYINEADYLVQLSDNEAYCYSVVEALVSDVPVICTPCPVFEEIGLVNKENCYYCDFNMDNVPINDIYNNIPIFTYKPKEDNWDNILAPGESKYQEKIKYKYLVKATNKYDFDMVKDAELDIIPKEGATWEVSYNRYKFLEDKGYVTLVTKKI